MKTHTIPPQKFDILLMFLPRFEEPGRTYLKGWQGRLPQYPDDVVAFFRWAKDGVWIDPGYDPKIASKLIQDDAYIAQATVDELRPLITFCVRGERFHDGHWANMLEQGRVQAILRRLKEIREEMEPVH
jgi:hypothetical protein